MYNTDLPRRADLPTSAQLARSTIIAVASAVAILVTIVLPSEYGIDPTGVGRVLGLTEMGEIKVQLAREAADDANATDVSANAAAPPPSADAVADQAPPQAPDPVGTLLSDTPPAMVPPARLGPVIEPIPTDRFAWAEPPSDVSEEPAPQAAVAATAVPEVPIPKPRPVRAAEAPQASAPEPAAPEPPGQEIAAAGRADELTFTLTPGQGIEIKLVMRQGARVNFAWSSLGGPINFDAHGDGSGRKISYEKGRGVESDAGVLKAAFDGNHGWFWRNRGRGDVSVTLRTSGEYTEIKRLL